MTRQQRFRLHAPALSFIKTSSLIFFLIITNLQEAAAVEASFPRLASYQIGGWGAPSAYNQDRVDTIAKLDVVVIGGIPNMNFEGHTIASITADIKTQNPDIVLLGYAGATEFPDFWADSRAYVESQTGPNGRYDWYARDAAGNKTTQWPGASNINLTNFVQRDANGDTAAEWLAKEYSKKFFDVGTYDGVFIDVFNVRPQRVADWNGDGIDDSPASPSVEEWHTIGQRAYFDTHKSLWPNHVMTGNIAGWSTPEYGIVPERFRGILDGGVFEGLMAKDHPNFQWSPHVWGGWSTMMSTYRDSMSYLNGPRYGFFHAIGNLGDYQFMRYALASCLMDDGYFAYGKDDHYMDIEWYDEYDVELGFAVDGPQVEPWSNGVYRRRFTGGMALVNPKGNGQQTVTIEAGYKRFTGTQDPAHNDGTAVTTLTLREGDGIILISENGQLAARPNPPVLLQ